MKKYIKHLFILVFIILICPFVVKAGFDDSTGAYAPPQYGEGCPRCSWTSSTNYYAGVRIALFKYNGTNLEKCGISKDLLNYNLRNDGSNVLWSGGVSRLEYTHFNEKFDFDELIPNFTLVHDYNGGRKLNYEGIWAPAFIENFSSYLGDDSETIKGNLNSLFGCSTFTEEEAGNYYITVEPTIRFWNRKRSIGVYGTAYELLKLVDELNASQYTYTLEEMQSIGQTERAWNYWEAQGNVIRGSGFMSMFVKQDNLKIFNAMSGSYDSNNFVNHNPNSGALITAAQGNKEYTSKSELKEEFDKNFSKNGNKDFAYGITVLWLRDVIEDTGDPPSGRTCKNYCAGYEGTALSNCAEQFCAANKPGDTTCVESCYDVAVDSPGCDRKKNNVCYNENLDTNNIKASNVCKASSETEDETLKSGICYDDVNTSDYVLESKNVVVNKNTGYLYIGNLTKPVNISYFKVECDEKVTFKNLPRQSVAHVSTTNTASLYIGYTLQYNRSCQIYYKKSDETWTTNFDESRAKAEYTKYEEALPAINKKISDSQKEYNELKNKSNKTKEEEAKMNSLKSYIETTEANRDLLKDIIKELKNVETDALNKLNRVKDSDYDPTTSMVNDVTIKIASQDGKLTTTHTLTLVPVYCLDTNVSSSGEKYCTLEDNVNYKWYKETNTVKCTNSAGNEIKATVNGGSSTYEKTVYYTLPPSYVGIDKNGAVIICHDEKCISDKKLPTSEMVEGAWVFDTLSQNVSLETYNGLLEEKSLVLNISGVGSCGQFSYDLDCSYQFESSKKCIDECIGEYNKPNTEMTEAEFNACFKKYCSCDSYCGSNVACRMKYCPQECEGCNDLSSGSVILCGDNCIEDCDSTYRDKEDNITCRYNNCCRNECNGEEGCIYNCCSSECDEKYNNHLISLEEYKKCKRDCLCENGSCETDYIYRTINLNRPFPDGDNSSGRIPGANWNNKESYITESSDIRTKYYDASDGRSDQYEYRIVLTSENIKQIKNDNSINKTYTEYKESKKARNTIEEATNKRNANAQANVYCSYIIHDYFETLGIKATSNVRDVKDQNILGSGCYVR